MAFLIDKCIAANVDEFRYTKPKKDDDILVFDDE
jgi:hypothetical protein